MAVRVIQGMAEGFLWPASFILINNWSPVAEINRIAAFVATGSYAGPILGFPISGAITNYIGWQYSFYASGASGILWLGFWWIFAYEKADHHPKISESELFLLRKNKTTSHAQCPSWRDVPWKSISTSKPFIAMCACAFAKGWVFNMLLMQEPTYMHVFGFSIAQNGIWSAMPFAFKLIVCYASGFLADFLVNKAMTSRTQVRKLFNTFGFGAESMCLFSLSFIYDGGLAIALLSTGISLGGLAVSGWQTNHLVLAPQLAGILVAVTQSFSNLAGIFSPLVAGYFIQESANLALAIDGDHHLGVSDTDIFGWHMVFLTSSLIVATCCTVYALFASGDEQNWAEIIPFSEAKESLIIESGEMTTAIFYQATKNGVENE
ncbi:vesicular glutamate transporter 1-like [Watersipora subatra]|uniref:vesicular glutamate transporter 1-like n=1 Tax=Watersipora subatra TaxID=2589382 RepID=UPI00355B5911